MAKKKPKKEFQYYLNPKTDELIILDIKENEIIIVPVIEEVSYEGKPYTEKDEEEYKEPEKPPTIKGKRKRTPITEEMWDKARELVKDGKKPYELMKELKICNTTAYKLYREIKKEIQKDVGK